MALYTAQITVGTTAVKLSPDPRDRRADSSVAVTAPAAATLYVGDEDVTADSGFAVAAGSSISVDLQSGEHLFGVLASGTGTVGVLAAGA